MSKVPFGMLSVKAGIDNNPKPTLADRIAGAKKAMAGRTFMYEQGGVLSDLPGDVKRAFPQAKPIGKTDNADERDADQMYADDKGMKYFVFGDVIRIKDKDNNTWSVNVIGMNGSEMDVLRDLGARPSAEHEVRAHGARGGSAPQDSGDLMRQLQKMGGGGSTYKYEQGGNAPQGDKKPFTLIGGDDEISPVMREMGEMGSREYVIYTMPDFKTKVKVYGNWNEYAGGQNEDGQDLIMDDDYPIVVNDKGEYVLDEARHNENVDNRYERKPVERMRNVTEDETFGQENRTQTLLDKLNKARGPRIFPRR